MYPDVTLVEVTLAQLPGSVLSCLIALAPVVTVTLSGPGVASAGLGQQGCAVCRKASQNCRFLFMSLPSPSV